MRNLVRNAAVTLGLAVLSLSPRARAVDGTWASLVSVNPAGPTQAGQNWSDPTRWVGSTIAGTVGTTTSTDTMKMLTQGHYTVTLDANYNVKFITNNAGAHRHAIVQTNGTSVLSLTSGGAITGVGNAHYYLPVRLEGGSGGSYSFLGQRLDIFGPVTGSASAGGNYDLILAGASLGSTFATSGLYVGSLGDGSAGGTLSVIKTGSGFWTLANASTYTGTTTVRNGRLKFSNANSLGIGTSAIVLGDSGTAPGDNIELEHANSITMSRDIVVNNFNSLGTTTLSVRNNLGGPVFSGNILLNRTVTIHTENTGFPTFTGVISGAGGIRKTGPNRATLSNANTFQGDATLVAGELRLNHVNALQTSTLDMGVSGSQFLTLLVAGNNTYNLGGLKGADDLAIGANTLSIGANHQSTTYSGGISGSNGKLTKVGLGTLALGGINTYTGITSVSNGTLSVNGLLQAGGGAVTVATGGALGGTGLVARATTIASTGHLAPGNSAGTLYVADLTLQSGAIYDFEGYDLTAVTNQLTLTSGWELRLLQNGRLGDGPGASVPLFTYVNQGTPFDLNPVINLSYLGFTPSTTLSLTALNGTVYLNGIQFVPEPSTALLLGVGGLLLWRTRRRG